MTKIGELKSSDEFALVVKDALPDTLKFLADSPEGIVGPPGTDGKDGAQGLKGDTGPAGIDVDAPVYTVLSSGTLAMGFAINTCVKITPSATQTLTTTVPVAGLERILIIVANGSPSKVVTFGTGFKPTGTLATGTTASRVFVIRFVSDGVNLYETSRTTAMVA